MKIYVKTHADFESAEISQESFETSRDFCPKIAKNETNWTKGFGTRYYEKKHTDFESAKMFQNPKDFAKKNLENR